GALITAEFAMDQGREVFAVPGRMDSELSRGPHTLIRQGAKLVLSIEDVLEELPIRVIKGDSPASPPADIHESLNGNEKAVLDIIKEGTISLEDLEARTGHSPSVLMGPLMLLQIKKLVRELPGKIYEFLGGTKRRK
ncbi:MAG: DNA-processing protein DprA, partial [Candidatus Omnitrophica bacterium]|nr:DNA-processing protein DprA [Candidatus Omnitrophota bacterium]